MLHRQFKKGVRVSKVTAADVEEVLAALIIGGRISGQLPSIARLKTDFRTSPTTIVKAVERLHSVGLVTQAGDGRRYMINRPANLTDEYLRTRLIEYLTAMMKTYSLQIPQLRRLIFDALLMPPLEATADLGLSELVELTNARLATYAGQGTAKPRTTKHHEDDDDRNNFDH
jgi:DNA-binding GntR family transcriptional regulator